MGALVIWLVIMVPVSALLTGLEELIEAKTGIHTVTAKDPMTAVAIGTGKYIDFMLGKKDVTGRR